MYTSFHKAKRLICNWLLGYFDQLTILPCSFKKLSFLFFPNTHFSFMTTYFHQLVNTAPVCGKHVCSLSTQAYCCNLKRQLQIFTLLITAPKGASDTWPSVLITQHHPSLGCDSESMPLTQGFCLGKFCWCSLAWMDHTAEHQCLMKGTVFQKALLVCLGKVCVMKSSFKKSGGFQCPL